MSGLGDNLKISKTFDQLSTFQIQLLHIHGCIIITYATTISFARYVPGLKDEPWMDGWMD